MNSIYPERYRIMEEDKIIPLKAWTRDRLKINVKEMKAC